MTSKVRTLEEAVGLVSDGDVVALQNMATQAAPMALVRELIRQEKRGLGLVCLVGGMAVDWLAAAGAIDRFIGAAVSMETFGLCQQYRKAVEEGRVRVEELSETALNARLAAGARNLPSLPTRGLLGTDLIDVNENLKTFEDPFTGETLVACRALVPDVALVHAHRADAYGNVQIEPTIVWPDLGIFPKAARKTIVVAEEIVPESVIRSDPNRTLIPGLVVDAVVHEPFGCHPSYAQGYYDRDNDFYVRWRELSQDITKFNSYLDEWVYGVRDRAEYVERMGASLKQLKARDHFCEPVNYGY